MTTNCYYMALEGFYDHHYIQDTDQYDTLVLSFANEETLDCDEINRTAHSLKNGLGFKNKPVKIIFDNSPGVDYSSVDFDYIEITWLTIVTKIKQEQSGILFNDSWNSNADKILFLMGKPNHVRYRVLCELKQFNPDLFEKLEYSYYGKSVEDNLIPLYKQVFAEKDIKVTRDDFVKFDNDLRRDLDLTPEQVVVNGQNHYTGFPCDPDLYKNTMMSIVLESEGKLMQKVNPTRISEKTWRAIANCHPIVLGNAGEAPEQFLENRGFDSYQDLFGEYAETNSYTSVSPYIDKIREMYSSVISNKDKLKERTKKNHDHFITYSSQELHRLMDYLGEDNTDFVSELMYRNH